MTTSGAITDEEIVNTRTLDRLDDESCTRTPSSSPSYARRDTEPNAALSLDDESCTYLPSSSSSCARRDTAPNSAHSLDDGSCAYSPSSSSSYARRDTAPNTNTVLRSVGENITKVYKKASSNNKIVLYLAARDLVIFGKTIDKVQGVAYVDPEFLQDRKVFGQVTLTFRYGREDEEVMGLKFCNEAIMCLAQLHPAHECLPQQPLTVLQKALVKRLGPNAHCFSMEITPLAPPSVQLVPAKEYNGAPIGTSYDVRAFVGHRADEKQNRRNVVKMGIRVVQLTSTIPRILLDDYSDDINTPRARIDKQFLLSGDGKVKLEAHLNKSVYTHNELINVKVLVENNTKRTVRKIKVIAVQHVDVCMFSNGKFKNVVAMMDSSEDCPIRPGCKLEQTYSLKPNKGSPKNWIALEDCYSQCPLLLAPSIICNSPEDRNVFAIYVSYYVKVKLEVRAIRGKFSIKLPFILSHTTYPTLQIENPIQMNNRIEDTNQDNNSIIQDTSDRDS